MCSQPQPFIKDTLAGYWALCKPVAAVETVRPVSQSLVPIQQPGGSCKGSYLLPLASGLGKYRRNSFCPWTFFTIFPSILRGQWYGWRPTNGWACTIIPAYHDQQNRQPSQGNVAFIIVISIPSIRIYWIILQWTHRHNTISLFQKPSAELFRSFIKLFDRINPSRNWAP